MDWADSIRYDIEARGSFGLDPNIVMSANPNRAQILRVLQTLLADRFKLRVRHDRREGDKPVRGPVDTYEIVDAQPPTDN